MRTIETTARVRENHKANLLLEFPPDISPGDYRMLVVVEEKAIGPGDNGHVDFDCQAWDWDGWPNNATFRREEIYGEDGR
jgi:hypothetical protein